MVKMPTTNTELLLIILHFALSIRTFGWFAFFVVEYILLLIVIFDNRRYKDGALTSNNISFCNTNSENSTKNTINEYKDDETVTNNATVEKKCNEKENNIANSENKIDEITNNNKGDKTSNHYYHRLTEYVTSIAPDVLKKYVKIKILKGTSFEAYLNTKKHVIWHLYSNCCCCQCSSRIIQFPQPVLSSPQFLSLYHKNDQIPKCTYDRGVRCSCKFSPEKNINIRVLDITLIHCLLKNCETLEPGADVWMDAIRKKRNKIFHYADSKSLTKDEFENDWKKLSGSVVGLANLISKDVLIDVKERTSKLRKKVFVSENTFAQVKLLKEYYQSKLAEYEILRQEAMRPYSDFLDNFSSEGSGGKKLFRKIEALNTAVDKIAICVSGNAGMTKILRSSEESVSESRVVPVLLHMDVPEEWDSKQILSALENLQLNASDDQSVRIKSYTFEDLNILVEVLRKVMKNTENLQNEIRSLVKGILNETDINTAKDANIDLKMFVNEENDSLIQPKTRSQYRFQIKCENLLENTLKCELMPDNKIIRLTSKPGIPNIKYELYLYNEEGKKLDKIEIPEKPEKPLSLFRYLTANFNKLWYFKPLNCQSVVLQISDCQQNPKQLEVFDIYKKTFSFSIPLPGDMHLFHNDVCHNFQAFKEEFVVLSFGTLYFIDMKGSIVCSIDIPDLGWYDLVFATKQHIICDDENDVRCFDRSGSLIYEQKLPGRISTCSNKPDGSIFVLVEEERNFSLHQISTDGQTLQKVRPNVRIHADAKVHWMRYNAVSNQLIIHYDEIWFLMYCMKI